MAQFDPVSFVDVSGLLATRLRIAQFRDSLGSQRSGCPPFQRSGGNLGNFGGLLQPFAELGDGWAARGCRLTSPVQLFTSPTDGDFAMLGTQNLSAATAEIIRNELLHTVEFLLGCVRGLQDVLADIWRVCELLDSLPRSSGDFGTATNRLRNAYRYLVSQEHGAARFELQLLAGSLPRTASGPTVQGVLTGQCDHFRPPARSLGQPVSEGRTGLPIGFHRPPTHPQADCRGRGA